MEEGGCLALSTPSAGGSGTPVPRAAPWGSVQAANSAASLKQPHEFLENLQWGLERRNRRQLEAPIQALQEALPRLGESFDLSSGALAHAQLVVPAPAVASHVSVPVWGRGVRAAPPGSAPQAGTARLCWGNAPSLAHVILPACCSQINLILLTRAP